MVAKTPFIRAALEAAIVALAISGGSVSALAHAKLLSVDRPPAVAERTAGTELRLSFSSRQAPVASARSEGSRRQGAIAAAAALAMCASRAISTTCSHAGWQRRRTCKP